MLVDEKIIEYRGHINYKTIGNLINEFKQKSESLGIQIGVYKKLLSVVVESLENIDKYQKNFSAEEYLLEHYSPMFLIEKSEEGYSIITGNPIKNQDIENLEKQINHLNSIPLEEIKKLYKTTVSDGHFNPNGGAGLGLIEIAKSGNKFNYEFNRINNDFSYYLLTIDVAPKKIKK